MVIRTVSMTTVGHGAVLVGGVGEGIRTTLVKEPSSAGLASTGALVISVRRDHTEQSLLEYCRNSSGEERT